MTNVVTNHYYGDKLRLLFLAGGFIMFLTLLFVQQYVAISIQMAILIILAIDVFAGITNPLWAWVSMYLYQL